MAIGDPRVAPAPGPRVLYISYDGALEPLGQSQVVPYLRGLAARGARITLMSFEKREDRAAVERVRALETDLAGAGIRWIPLVYHKRPTLAATALDVLLGLVRGLVVVRTERMQAVHARSYVAALLAWGLKRLTGVRFIFDMRGFWADERVEAGLWPRGGSVYRVVKRLEHRFLRDADEIVTLTERARATIERWPTIPRKRVTVVPTCVDLGQFAGSAGPGRHGGDPVFVYAGSLGTWYLGAEILRFVETAVARFPDSRLLLLTRNQGEAGRALGGTRLHPDRVTIAAVAHDQVPAWLARADVGLAFYKPGWARQATCPTKVGEYLAMGLPVVVNDAVGDMQDVVAANRVGTVLSEFSPSSYGLALDELSRLRSQPGLAERCRRVAEAYFSLGAGVERYWAIYGRVA